MISGQLRLVEKVKTARPVTCPSVPILMANRLMNFKCTKPDTKLRLYFGRKISEVFVGYGTYSLAKNTGDRDVLRPAAHGAKRKRLSKDDARATVQGIKVVVNAVFLAVGQACSNVLFLQPRCS